MNYDDLKKKIVEILEDLPADLYDDDSGVLFQADTWELVNNRDLSIYEEEDQEELEIEEDDYDLKYIGSANLIVANTVLKKALQGSLEPLAELKRVSSNNTVYHTKESVEDLFELIMQDLEEERIIRRKPEIVRQGFKVVGGTDVRINSTN
jgi:hypothetical protein